MREAADPLVEVPEEEGLLEGLEPSGPRKGLQAGHERAFRMGFTARIAASRDASSFGPSSM